MPESQFDLSLVIPLLNEQDVFPQLIERLDNLLQKLGLRAEVLLIDDGSTDQTPALIKDICTKNPAFKGVILSRNFGHQLAVTAGMMHARGTAVAILDGDLQDPPEVISEFYLKLQQGFDVVYAVRQERKENILKRFAYAAFYRVMRHLATIPIPLDSGDFCIMSRRVVDEVNAMRERHRFIRGLRSWVGFRQTAHPYPRAARHAGTSKYSFTKLLRLAFDGIFTFSELPLQWSAQFGLVVALAAVAYAVFIVVWRLFSNQASNATSGFATLAVGLFFIGGVQLISIGILGQYIGRIHNEVKNRPLFIVESLHGFDPPR
ncbi:MAG TPA: glycosyltransferase family 2 protein [Phycisphaerae bacterium]|jgi:dolichol-phosphate mannosyltransferase|nr:glycosyltransferase family 2 protein [Phycisphaerae bacterium]